MKRNLSLFLGFLVGVTFIVIPFDRFLFEGFTGMLNALYEIIGFIIITTLAFPIVMEAFRNIRRQ